LMAVVRRMQIHLLSGKPPAGSAIYWRIEDENISLAV